MARAACSRRGGWAMSNIEWTDTTWNPVIGCTPVSPGCLNCYAATMARRLEAMGRPEYAVRGLETARGKVVRIAEVRNGRAVFTGEVRCLPERLTEPLHWKRPRMVFVNSMSDLFHEAVPDRFIRLVFAAMSYCGQHTFQVLTKRPERMAAWLADPENSLSACQAEWVVADIDDRTPTGKRRIGRRGSEGAINGSRKGLGDGNYWPLPNVWLGTSVEDQARADERIPHLLRCPAAVRFLSCEPLLGAVDLHDLMGRWFCAYCDSHYAEYVNGCPRCHFGEEGTGSSVRLSRLHWAIVGGESGPHAREFREEWAKSIRDQCADAGVPFFFKQYGSNATRGGEPLAFKDRKGADPAEWPEDLRVRQFPEVRR